MGEPSGMFRKMCCVWRLSPCDTTITEQCVLLLCCVDIDVLWCVQVKWSEPDETGGRDIVEYQVQMSPGQKEEGQSEVTASDFVTS